MKAFVDFCLCYTPGLLVKNPVLQGPKRLGPKTLDLGSQMACGLWLGLLAALEGELSSAVCEIKCATIA